LHNVSSIITGKSRVCAKPNLHILFFFFCFSFDAIPAYNVLSAIGIDIKITPINKLEITILQYTIISLLT